MASALLQKCLDQQTADYRQLDVELVKTWCQLYCYVAVSVIELDIQLAAGFNAS